MQRKSGKRSSSSTTQRNLSKSYKRELIKALANNELIGLHCKVVRSSQKSLIGLEGKIVDETLNMLAIDTSKGEKKLQKKSITLEIDFPDGKFIIDGKDIMQRPHERLRKIWRKLR